MRYIVVLATSVTLLFTTSRAAAGQTERSPAGTREPAVFRAGAIAVDVTPATFPVLVNGGFLENRATRSNDPIRAKCLVLDDGAIRLAIVVVDSCMMPRELLDRAKELARERAGIPPERILISATHTHSAPAAMGALGCRADAGYVAFLPGKIAESIERASKLLEPARAGWTAIDDNEHTFCRRWIRRPDKMLDDPFGQRNVRANMHPGYQNPDAIAPAGPVDPSLTLLAVQSTTGRPIAVLANYSMHYYGVDPVSSDYFGRFAAAFAKKIGAQAVEPPFVGIMSQGTSGDQMWMDYGQPKNDPGVDAYADAVARYAQQGYTAINYRDHVSLAMAETNLVLNRRVPDPSRLAWARGVVERMAGRDIPTSLPEVYAREAIALHEKPQRELKLQAVRIGELGITAIPNEVFAITGLKIKAQSPFDTTMNIELANGSEGYIPPPEQHALGGYTTWPARTAGLEVRAEPKIVDAVLRLLEQVAGKARKDRGVTHGPYTKSVLASNPLAYWRLDDIEGTVAHDYSKHGHHGRFEGGFALYLPGPDARGVARTKAVNRAVHFAGGRLKAELEFPADTHTVELWFWNGLVNDARPITGILFSLGSDRAVELPVDALGIDGRRMAPGRLFISANTAHADIFSRVATEIKPRTWHHLAYVRAGQAVTVYLDGKPEIGGAVPMVPIKGLALVSIGGGIDDGAAFEGKIDEISLYDRALAADEVANHFRAAQGTGLGEP